METTYHFKVLLLGDSDIGIPQLLFRLIEDKWMEDPPRKMGIDFQIKTLKVDNQIVKLSIWDSAGKDGYYLTSTYLRGAQGVIFLYNRYDMASFRHLPDWIDRVQQSNASGNFVRMILGHDYRRRSDEAMCVTEGDGAEVSTEHKALHFLVNSETGENVQLATETFVRRLIQSATPHPSPSSSSTIRLSDSPSSPQPQPKCCN